MKSRVKNRPRDFLDRISDKSIVFGVHAGVAETLLWAISNTDWYPSAREFKRMTRELEAATMKRIGK